ncbi:MAG: hypothetical protein A3B68_07060 [Candidatus Melainabacteria bacterium RIFCSPHIGHO2_02_FULL_34_12]|nr:MAG: hypothetical protein A3B68_07060 [Candidatus Melainabacteria bacterium RIFCSPHIGHO2_02_FULL_34_12]
MSISLSQILNAQMLASAASPLSAPNASTSFEQVKIRMAQEAVISGSDTIELRHLLGALICNPNGRVKLCLSSAIRIAEITEQNVRDRLGLGEYDSNIVVAEDMQRSNDVKDVYLLTMMLSRQAQKDRPDTSDLLSAIVAHLTKDRQWISKSIMEQANFLVSMLVVGRIS